MLRSTLFHGPGHLLLGTTAILAADDIKVVLKPEYDDVGANGYGVIDRRRKNLKVEVTCTPLEWNNLSLLLPYAATQIGASVFGGGTDTDVPLSIVPRNGAASGLALTNVAVTKMPGIRFAATKGPLGSMTFTGIIAGTELADPTADASYYATAAVGTLPAPDLTKLRTGVYHAVWGAALPKFFSEDGFEVEADLQLQEVMVDGYGTIDMTLSGLTAGVKVTPVGVSMAQLLTAVSGGLGKSPAKADLLIKDSSDATVFTLHNCQCLSGEASYGNNAKRVSALEFKAVRSASGGALSQLWTIV